MAVDPRCILKNAVTSHSEINLGASESTAHSYYSSLSASDYSLSFQSPSFSHLEHSPDTQLSTYTDSTPGTLASEHDSCRPTSFKCPLCSEQTRAETSYGSGESLCQHSRAEHSKTLYPCLFFNDDGCTAVFRTNRDRNRHHSTRQHSQAPADSEFSLRCACGKADFRRDNFVRHVAGCRDRSDKKQRCFCGDEFEQDDKLGYCSHLATCSSVMALEAARKEHFQ